MFALLYLKVTSAVILSVLYTSPGSLGKIEATPCVLSMKQVKTSMEACHGEGSREKMKEGLAKDLSLSPQGNWYQRHPGSCHKDDESSGSSLQP